jgi:type IV secretory pathway VirB2 component (pilin)
LDVGGNAGAVAIIVTLAICYMAIMGKNIPEVMANALTLILGFYFGTKVKRENHR